MTVKLKTRDSLLNVGVCHNDLCEMCNIEVKTCQHVFFRFLGICRICQAIMRWIDITMSSNENVCIIWKK